MPVALTPLQANIDMNLEVALEHNPEQFVAVVRRSGMTTPVVPAGGALGFTLL